MTLSRHQDKLLQTPATLETLGSTSAVWKIQKNVELHMQAGIGGRKAWDSETWDHRVDISVIRLQSCSRPKYLKQAKLNCSRDSRASSSLQNLQCMLKAARRQAVFFSSSLAVDALWHGPDRYISGEKNNTKHSWPAPNQRQIKSQPTKATTQNKTTRKSPSQTCVSPPKKQTNKKTGPGPNKNNHTWCLSIQRPLPL